MIADVEAGGDAAELADRFAGTLEFGTAGLRGALGAGPNRMNRVVVTAPPPGSRRTCATRAPPATPRGDRLRRPPQLRRLRPRHRRGDDRRRARAPTCCPARCPRRCWPSRSASSAASPASWSPPATTRPQDNGYKVYLGDGARSCRPPTPRSPRGSPPSGRWPSVPRGDGGHDRSARTSSTATSTPSPASPATARATSTSSTRRCTASAATSVVAGARDRRLRRARAWWPSRSSPTPTSRPSPSRTRRSRARWTSRWRWPREHGADLVVANDPDADRCAVAVPGAARLADAARRRGRRAARPTTCCAARQAGHLRDARSSPRRCSARSRPPPGSRTPRRSPASSGSAGSTGLAFGYEEALGYCVDPEHVRDKDGISALLLLCELAAAPKAAGPHPLDLLDDLAAEHGLHATDQLSVRVDRPRRDRGRDGAAARDAARRRSAGSPSSAVDDLARAGRPAADRRACATGWPRAPG